MLYLLNPSINTIKQTFGFTRMLQLSVYLHFDNILL